MMKFLRAICALQLALALAPWASSPSLALDPPGNAEIGAALGAELPAYWTVSKVEIAATVNLGDDVSPRYRQRFVADATPADNLFLPAFEDAKFGPFILLITTHRKGEVRKLYGIATSVLERGEWSKKLDLANTVTPLGRPRSLYEGPSIVAATEQTAQVVKEITTLQQLAKTVAESVARSSANAETLQRLLAEEKAALRAANRKRLVALRQKYAQERQVIAEAAHRARQQLETVNRKGLEALKVKLLNANAEVEKMTTAAELERKQFIAVNHRRLEVLKALYAKKRASAKATARTLQLIDDAEAETEAQKKLAAAFSKLAKHKKRTKEIAQKATLDDLARKAAHNDTLLAGLRGDSVGKRTATLDAVLAGKDAQLKRLAIDTALKSGDNELQAKALAALIAKSSRFTIEAKLKTKKGEIGIRRYLFKIEKLDRSSLSFTGKFVPPSFVIKERNGSGSIDRNVLTFAGNWKTSRYFYSCIGKAGVDSKGKLVGTITCSSRYYTDNSAKTWTAPITVNL